MGNNDGTTRARRVLTGIHPRAWEHPADKAALQALRRLPVFDEILHDETFHMNYTLTQLARISPQHHRRHIWRARVGRLWKAYLRVASGVAGVIGTLLITVQYFVLMPLFAWLAKRAARRERPGWAVADPDAGDSLTRQY